MNNQQDKKLFLDTIKFAPWLFIMCFGGFIVSLYFNFPRMFILPIGIVFGALISVALPIAWSKGYDWIPSIILLPTSILLSSHYEVFGLQIVLLTLSVTSILWVVFKKVAIRYV